MFLIEEMKGGQKSPMREIIKGVALTVKNLRCEYTRCIKLALRNMSYPIVEEGSGISASDYLKIREINQISYLPKSNLGTKRMTTAKKRNTRRTPEIEERMQLLEIGTYVGDKHLSRITSAISTWSSRR